MRCSHRIDLDIDDLLDLLAQHDIAVTTNDNIMLVIYQHGEVVSFDLEDLHIVLEVDDNSIIEDGENPILPFHTMQ